jgi:hypothetical protein
MSQPRQLYRCVVSPVLTGFGLHVRTIVGRPERITDGVAIIHDGGVAYDPEKWHMTREAAEAAAADEIERLIAPAVGQVERLRQGVAT